MNRHHRPGACPGAPAPSPVRSDALNRRSLEFPHRKVYDASSQQTVKKSFSFDWRPDGEVVSRIVEDEPKKPETPTSARKVCLAYSNSGRVLSVTETKLSAGDKVSSDDSGVALSVGDSDSGLVSSCLRPGPRRARALRCRSSPPTVVWPPERVPPTRLCRTWYAGYGTLVEDEPLFIPQVRVFFFWLYVL